MRRRHQSDDDETGRSRSGTAEARCPEDVRTHDQRGASDEMIDEIGSV